MNTPPPPLLPITEDTINGLYHYFGQPNNQPSHLKLLCNVNTNNGAANASANTSSREENTSWGK